MAPSWRRAGGRARAGASASLPAVPRLSPALLAVVALAATAAGCGKSGSAQPITASPSTVAPPGVQGVLGVATKNTTRIGGEDPVVNAAAVARTVYPGLTTATRPQAVVLVDEHDWPAALAVSVLASSPLGAPLLYTDGNSLPLVSAQALAAMHPSGASTLGGTQVIEVGNSAPLPTSYHATAVATGTEASAIAASLEGLVSAMRGTPPSQVIVLPAEAPMAMQMPAAGLSAESGAPILFVTVASIPPATATVLSHLHSPDIYFIDSSYVSGPVRQQLARFGTVHHVTSVAATAQPSGQPSGSARELAAQNAIAIARYSDGTFGWGIREPGHGVLFATSARPLDGPASALLSASGDYGPLLLTENPYVLPPSLVQYLSDIQPAYSTAPQFQPVHGAYNHGWLIGGEHAISAIAQAEIDSLLEIAPTQSPAPAPTEAVE